MDEEQKLTREEFAVTDLGHTEISLTAAKLFFIIFAVMIVTVPATHVIRHGRTVGSIFPVIEAAFKTNSLQEFNDTLKNGFHDYENAINETMPVREAFLKVNKKLRSFGKRLKAS